MDIDARMASVMGGTQVAFDVRPAAIAITSLAAFGALFLVAQRVIDAADHFAPPPLTDPKVEPLHDASDGSPVTRSEDCLFCNAVVGSVGSSMQLESITINNF